MEEFLAREADENSQLQLSHEITILIKVNEVAA